MGGNMEIISGMTINVVRFFEKWSCVDRSGCGEKQERLGEWFEEIVELLVGFSDLP